MNVTQTSSSHSASWPGLINGDDGEAVVTTMSSLKAPLKVDGCGSVTNADGTFVPLPGLLATRLVVHMGNELARKEEALDRGMRFMTELTDSVECLTAVAEEHGARTLADLLYLHAAIISGGFVDFYPDESQLLKMVQELPSSEEWMVYIKQEELTSDAPPREKDRLFIRAYRTGIVYADWADKAAGDCDRVAFLPYDTLKLEVKAGCPDDLRVRIEAHAAEIQKKKGARFEVSSSGFFVTLGEAV